MTGYVFFTSNLVFNVSPNFCFLRFYLLMYHIFKKSCIFDEGNSKKYIFSKSSTHITYLHVFRLYLNDQM